MTPLLPLPDQMTAIDISTPGGPEVLRAATRPVPTPRDNDVLIKVAAAGVNRPDLLQRMGKYPPPAGASDIPGLEVAGVIIAHGPNCAPDTPAIGTRVCALVSGGGYAEYTTAPTGQIIPLPDTIDDIHGAAIPETLFTVYQNVVQLGRLTPNASILIHGGASGIGTMAIQVVRYLRDTCHPGRPQRDPGPSAVLVSDEGPGSRDLRSLARDDTPLSPIIVTCGTDDKSIACLNLGATHTINYRTETFEDRVMEITNGRGVDIILDMVAGDYVARNITCMANGGRHVTIAVQGGATATIDMRRVMTHNITLTGSTLRPRSVAQKTALRDAILRDIWPGVISGAITPVIHATFSLNQASSAHAALERGDHVGKIVLINDKY